MGARLRRFLLAGSLAALSRAESQATPTADPKGNAEQFSLQFAVPVSPAFKLVEVGSSSILRPTNFQQLSTSLGNFGLSDGSLQLPTDFGIELAPFFLAHGRRLSLGEYRKHAALYRLRVSAAVHRRDDAAGATDVAFGLRVALRDGTDPRTASEVLGKITKATDMLTRMCTSEVSGPPSVFDQPGVVETCADPRKREKGMVDSLDKLSASPVRDSLAARLEAFRAHKAKLQAQIDSINTEVQEIRETWPDSAWNRSGIEMALGYAAGTADSLGNDPHFRTAAAWLSLAQPFGNWGQLVLGATGSIDRDTLTRENNPRWDAGTALYVGGNKYKAFVELEGAFKEGKSGFVANAGAEFFLTSGTWANAKAGWTREPGEAKSRLLTRLTIRAKLPFRAPTIAIPGATPRP